MPHPSLNGNIAGKRIKELRERNGIEQKELATVVTEKYGIQMDRRTLSKIENNKRTVRDLEIDALAKALETTPDDLLGWID